MTEEKNEQKNTEHEHEHKGETPPLPAMNFQQLIDTFLFQAMVSLGKQLNPMTGKYQRDLNLAQYQISILDLLQEKTKGNLTKAEEEHLGNVLHTARMAYLHEKEK